MNWSRIVSSDAWKGLLQEAAWKLAPRRDDAAPAPTWPLDPRELEKTSILWPARYPGNPGKWVDSIRRGFSKYVKIEQADIPQPFEDIFVLRAVISGVRRDIALDCRDTPEINAACARSCPVYFKMQFAEEGYPFAHVLPGGYVPNSDMIYEYLPHVRALADENSPRYDVYGRFGMGLSKARDIRRKANSLLARQDRFRWEGGLQIKRYSLALREIARAKICIDLPGNGDFCFRLIDYFAVGVCVVGPRPHNALHVPLEDRKNIVYAKPDLSDLVELCAYYLKNDAAREEVARNSRSYFDKYLHRDQLAAYYLRSCFDRLS